MTKLSLELHIPPNTTRVLAVSGGVDSVVLLDIMSRRTDGRWIVAHADHGIRPESAADARFVRGLAERYGLPFVGEALRLGPNASEAAARSARYRFLRRVAREHRAAAIVTAHHADDVIETVVLNLRRGTGWRGLASLRSQAGLVRPLLRVPKAGIVGYALHRRLEWCEDGTNRSPRYARNRLRQETIPRALAGDPAFKDKMGALWRRQCALRREIEPLVAALCERLQQDGALPRDGLLRLDERVGLEILRCYLQQHAVRQTRPQLCRALGFVRAARTGALFSLDAKRLLGLRRAGLVVVTAGNCYDDRDDQSYRENSNQEEVF